MAGNYNSLMDVAPGMAAYMTGQDQEQARQTEFIRQRELEQLISARTQEASQKAEMNPLLLQEKGLQNRGLEAGLGGIAADSRLKGTKADLAQGTLATDILAGNAKNQGIADSERNDRVNREQDLFTSLGVAAGDQPAPLRMQAIRNGLAKAGIDPDGDKAKPLLEKLAGKDPEQYPEFFAGLARRNGQIRALQTPAWHVAMDQQAFKERGDTDRNEATNAKDIEVAKIQAAAKVRAAELRKTQDNYLQTLAASKNFEMAATRASIMAENEEDPVRKQGLLNFAAKMEASLQAAKQAGATPSNKIDTPAVADLPASRTPTPLANAAAGGARPPASAASAAQGATPAGRVRVIDANGKVGHIPANQLQDALDQGYKRAP